MKKFIAFLSLFVALSIGSPINDPKNLVPRAPPLSDGVSILDTINHFRTAYKVSNLTWSDQVKTKKIPQGFSAPI